MVGGGAVEGDQARTEFEDGITEVTPNIKETYPLHRAFFTRLRD